MDCWSRLEISRPVNWVLTRKCPLLRSRTVYSQYGHFSKLSHNGSDDHRACRDRYKLLTPVKRSVQKKIGNFCKYKKSSGILIDWYDRMSTWLWIQCQSSLRCTQIQNDCSCSWNILWAIDTINYYEIFIIHEKRRWNDLAGAVFLLLRPSFSFMLLIIVPPNNDNRPQ